MNPGELQTPQIPQKKVRITTQSQLFNLTIPEASELDELNLNPIYEQLISASTGTGQYAFPELKSELEKNIALYEGGTPAEVDASLFKHLDRWKKDQVLVNSKNSNENRILRNKHKSSLQQGDDFPKVNLDILDSILRIPPDDSIHGNQNNYHSKVVAEKGNKTQKDFHQEEAHKNSITEINSSLRTINLLRKQKSIAFDPLIKNLHDKDDKGTKAETTSLFKDSITSDSRQRLVNKKLVNNLIFDRITKTYGSGGLEAHSHRSQFNSYSTQKAETLFQDEIHRFSQHTLANFKQLLHTFEKSKHIIDYQGIRQKLMVFIRSTPSILINENENEDQSNGQYMAQKRGKEQRYHYKMTEQALLNNYKSISKEIEMKYSRIQEGRGAAHELRSQINDLQKEQSEFDEKAKKEMIEKKYNLNRASLSKSQMLIQQSQENQKLEEAAAIKQTIETQQKAIHDAFQQSKVKIEREVEKQGNYIDDDQKEVKMLKQKREITRSLLKELYYEYMKDQENTKGQSLIWIAKAMLGVEIDLVTSESFPPFLDTSSIQFLSEFAALDNTLDRLQEQMKKTAIENSKVKDGKYDDFEKNYLAAQHSQRILDVKTKIKRIAMSDMLKVRRPIFIASQGKSAELTFEEIQEPKETENITFSLSKAPVQKLNQIRQNQTVREEIAAIQAKQQALKEKEVQRLFEKWLSMKNESKNDQDLKVILIALMGQTEAEEQIKVYRQTFAGKQANVEKNKTFTFSRATLIKNHIHRDDGSEKNKNKSVFFSNQLNTTLTSEQNLHANHKTTSESSSGSYFLKLSIYPQRNSNQQCFSIPAPMVRRIKEIKQNSYPHSDRDNNLNYQSNKTHFNNSSTSQQKQKYSISTNNYLSQRFRQSQSYVPEFSTFNLTTQEISPPQSERSYNQKNFMSPRHNLFQAKVQ